MSQRSGTLKPIKSHGFPCWNKVCWMILIYFVAGEKRDSCCRDLLSVRLPGFVRQLHVCAENCVTLKPLVLLFKMTNFGWILGPWLTTPRGFECFARSASSLTGRMNGSFSTQVTGAAPASSLFSSDELLVWPQAARPAVANLWNHFFEQPGGDLPGETILQSQVKGKGRTAGGRWLLEKRLRQKWSKTGPTFVNHSLSKYYALLKKKIILGQFLDGQVALIETYLTFRSSWSFGRMPTIATLKIGTVECLDEFGFIYYSIHKYIFSIQL